MCFSLAFALLVRTFQAEPVSVRRLSYRCWASVNANDVPRDLHKTSARDKGRHASWPSINMQGQCRSLSVEAQCFMGFGQAHVSAFAENSARESRSRQPSTSRQPCAMHNVASTKRAIAAQDGPVILGRALRPRCSDYRSGNAPKAL